MAARPWVVAREATLPKLPRVLMGVDEAGRGPLAGPVTAAAVILNPRRPISGLADSKQLTAARRAELAARIREKAVASAVFHVEASEIDQINILQAALRAMQLCIAALARSDAEIWIDGNQLPKGLQQPARAIIGGDARVAAISAASILAKTTRDALMLELHQQYPQYGFDQHAGYPVPVHLAALRAHGPCPQHRMSYAPVRAACVHTPAVSQAGFWDAHAP